MNTLNELLSNLKEKSDAGKDANRIIDFIGDMKKKELPETEVMPAEDGKETFTYLGVLRRLDEKLLDSEEPEEPEEPTEDPNAPKFTVTFKNGDDSVAGTKEVTANKAVGDGPEPTVEEGYVFIGWSTDRYNPEYIVDLATFTTDKDVTLWAMAEEDDGEVIIDGDGPVDDDI